MTFNSLISNIDVHPLNHVVIAKDLYWKLSPAEYLTPSTPVAVDRRDLAMACGDAGRYANASNLLTQSTRFLLPNDHAVSLVADMEHRVTGTWYDVARTKGVSERDCSLIAGAFVYPGFRLSAD